MAQRPQLGGTDGFRGEFARNGDPGSMCPDTFSRYTYAHIKTLQEIGYDGPVVLARDSENARIGNPYLVPAALAGAREAGAEVLYVGTMPTPGAQRVAQEIGAMCAIVATASHNKHTDGGWKGTIGAEKPFGQEVRHIDNRFWEIVESGLAVPSTAELPKPETAYTERYIRDIVTSICEKFGHEQPLKNKLFVIDSANGAASFVAPVVFRRLGADVQPIYNNVGKINDGCGAANLTGLENYLKLNPEIVADKRFVGAIATDGDADRMMAVGATIYNGKVRTYRLDGNIALELFAEGQSGVVGTTYTNDASVKRILSSRTEFEFCDNGDVYVTHKLREHSQGKHPWQIGSEFTGHHVDLSWLPSGDGTRAAAWLASLASTQGTTFAKIVALHPLKPQILHNFRLPADIVLDKDNSDLTALNEQTETDKQNGARSIARPSGTEPLFRLCVMGNTEKYVRQKLAEGLITVGRVIHVSPERIKVSESKIA